MNLDQYGLSAPPFQLTPDARFWFESATHKKAMAYLGYGLQQGEGFIVVTGEIGAGKTTLVGHLRGRLDPSRVNAVQLVSTQVDHDDLLRLVGQGFGISVAGLEKAQLLGAIEQFLGDRARAGQRTLLIVDEAQALPLSSLEELRMLSNFQGQGRALLQILLLGQPEFRDMINAPSLEQLRQRVIASHHLVGMEQDEVGAYLNHRLALVGWQGRPTITAEAVAAIFRATGGIPRKVNTIAARALLMAAMSGADVIDPRTIAMVTSELSAESPEAVIKKTTPNVTSLHAAPVGVSTPPTAHPELLDAAARLAMIEAQVTEQDAALRRILSLLVDWIEGEQPLSPPMAMFRAPAA
jgi:general secretion pathway protein A